MGNKKEHDISYTMNRELSWLKFNQRVLEEACDDTVPLFERLKFVSIFENNLDEFYMVRVGSLVDISLIKNKKVDNKSGMTAMEQLKAIFKETAPLYKKKDKIFNDIEEKLQKYHISRLSMAQLNADEKRHIDHYFEKFILPVLSPQIVDMHHPFPHLINKSLYIAVMLRKDNDQMTFGFIPVPQMLPSILFLPSNDIRYVNIESIILHYADKVFDMFKLEDRTVICVTRNADISPEDEAFSEDEDYRHHMQKILKKRKRLAPVRLEVQNDANPQLIDFLCDKLQIKHHQVFKSHIPLDLSYVFQLQDSFNKINAKAITYSSFKPQPSPMVNKNESIIRQVIDKDLIFHYPYEEMDPFLLLLKEASEDPTVLSIKITIYRLANFTKIVEYLKKAADNDKEVIVLMELRARFDEQNNIQWAEELEEAGCNVTYGFEDYKVHSKICLITRVQNNNVSYITQIGTGNYNEKTAKLYTDVCLITANEQIGTDAANFFKNMAISNLHGQYEHLLVAPTSLKQGIIDLIDEEIDKVNAGKKGAIIMKMNSLTDRGIITKLSEASCAGVNIQLIIRGICCLVPGIKGKTENISVISIVGRFLEHSRIYVFGENEEMKMYISSADIMTRNTEKRVEIACPILDPHVKKRISEILKVQLHDNVKARVMLETKEYVRRIGDERMSINSQDFFMEEAVNEAGKQMHIQPSYQEIKSTPFKKIWTKLFTRSQNNK